MTPDRSTSTKPWAERALLAVAILSTLSLAVRLWDQPSRTDALAERVEALERTLQSRAAGPDDRTAPPQDLREQQVAAAVVQALGPRLDQLAQKSPPGTGAGTAPSATARPELTPEQAAAAKAAGELVDAAIARGRLDEVDATPLREKLRVLGGTPEGNALVARLFAAMNQGKLQVEMRHGAPAFLQ